MRLLRQSIIYLSLLAFNNVLQAQAFEEYFTTDSLATISTTSIAGLVTNFSLDTACEVLLLSVEDPNTAPLPAFNAYQVKPSDSNGELITNIEGIVNTTFRVSSLETVTFDILFRSGGGVTNERSARKSMVVPGGLDQWTEFTISWSTSELEGFDPTDLLDMWFYLDRGVENFAGNELYIDHITIGTAPDSDQNSDCIFVSLPQNWTENWNTNNPTEFIGSDVDRMAFTIDEICEELKIEVIDSVENPYQAFRPIFLDPLDENGLDIGVINDNPFVKIRARSTEGVALGVLLRSGDGTADFRTDLLTETITGDLTAFSNLTFEFDASSIGGFNREEFLDIWIYLDRDVDNFAGNEVYFDFISLGEAPDISAYSPCGLPDLIVDVTAHLNLAEISAYPNPATDILRVQLSESHNLEDVTFVVTNMLGQKVVTQQLSFQNTAEIDLVDLDNGLYCLNILTNNRVVKTIKFIKIGIH